MRGPWYKSSLDINQIQIIIYGNCRWVKYGLKSQFPTYDDDTFIFYNIAVPYPYVLTFKWSPNFIQLLYYCLLGPH